MAEEVYLFGKFDITKGRRKNRAAERRRQRRLDTAERAVREHKDQKAKAA
jgi:hypothetical protein